PAGVFRPLIRLFLRRADVVIVLSEIEKAFLQTHYPSLPADKIKVIPNAVALPALPEGGKDFQAELAILFLGRIDWAKGLGRIAAALECLSKQDIPFRFYLCGVGPDKARFIQMLTAEVRSRVRDLGLVYGERKQAVLQASHIYLLPSDFEGLPLSLLECMSYGLVPVVSAVGSMPLVVKETNGCLVSTVEEIVAAISRLHADRDRLRALSQAARLAIEAGYSDQPFLRRMQSVNNSLFHLR
ncbi:MAG: glycosyltransferase family 4 protein, partial [Tannerellaceae bacterium]|nr:glycosyltransferase family 4 protein [Tannerellaceae bacterium]